MPVSRLGPIKRLLSVLVFVGLLQGSRAVSDAPAHVEWDGVIAHNQHDPVPCSGFRFGEAENPGPDASFCLSSSNPSGLRAKEGIVCEFLPGIHCIAETQLSSVTLPTSVGTLRSLARKQNRTLRVLPGAPAAIRSHSGPVFLQPVTFPAGV